MILARTYEAVDDVQSSIAVMESVLRDDTKPPESKRDAKLYLPRVYRANRDIPGAVRAIENFFLNGEGDINLCIELVEIAGDTGNHGRAIEILNKAVEQQPEIWSFRRL
jgi:hypothetical protein